MKRKPKWWNIDWIELGCRGWDIEIDGASLGPQRENPWEYDYADLDRDTLHIVMSGRPAFVARVLSDLIAAGVLQRGPAMTWLIGSGTSTADNTSTGTNAVLRLAS